MATDKLADLKARAAKLDATIVDKDAKDYLLRLAKNWLGDVERKVAPGIETVMLPLIEQQLKNTEEAVAKYGPNVCIVGK
jgi:hypothetical protein